MPQSRRLSKDHTPVDVVKEDIFNWFHHFVVGIYGILDF